MQLYEVDCSLYLMSEEMKTLAHSHLVTEPDFFQHYSAEITPCQGLHSDKSNGQFVVLIFMDQAAAFDVVIMTSSLVDDLYLTSGP